MATLGYFIRCHYLHIGSYFFFKKKRMMYKKQKTTVHTYKHSIPMTMTSTTTTFHLKTTHIIT